MLIIKNNPCEKERSNFMTLCKISLLQVYISCLRTKYLTISKTEELSTLSLILYTSFELKIAGSSSLWFQNSKYTI